MAGGGWRVEGGGGGGGWLNPSGKDVPAEAIPTWEARNRQQEYCWKETSPWLGGTAAGQAIALCVQGPGFHPQHCYKEQKESRIQSLTSTLTLPPGAGFPGLVYIKLT